MSCQYQARPPGGHGPPQPAAARSLGLSSEPLSGCLPSSWRETSWGEVLGGSTTRDSSVTFLEGAYGPSTGIPGLRPDFEIWKLDLSIYHFNFVSSEGAHLKIFIAPVAAVPRPAAGPAAESLSRQDASTERKTRRRNRVTETVAT